MFKKIILKNFKSFHNIEFDLTGVKGKPKKYAFVYGENGSGKSNLMLSFVFLKESLDTLDAQDTLKEAQDFLIEAQQGKEIDTVLKSKILKAFSVSKRKSNSLENIAAKNQMIDSSGNMYIRYDFYLDEKSGYYELSFENNILVQEKLYFLVNKQVGALFEIKREKGKIQTKLSTGTFLVNKYKKELDELLEKYWGKHSFMAILINEWTQKNEEFMSKRISKSLLQVLLFFQRFCIRCNYSSSEIGYQGVSNRILAALDQGEIEKNKKNELLSFEEALNDFFTRVYSDVKKVFYKITESDNKTLEYELFFLKRLAGKERKVSFREESTGTRKLIDYFSCFYECELGNTVLIDEIDSGIHDILMSLLMDGMLESFKGQFIVTTHNTTLLESIDANHAYILQIDGLGNNKLRTIKNITGSSQKNHNNRIRYLAGLFQGIPLPTDVDFSDIVKQCINSLNKKRIEK